MAVLLLTGDLMSVSRVELAARQAGTAFRLAASGAAAEEHCGTGAVSLLMVDLTTPGLDLAAVVSTLKQSSLAPPVIVAYGPHVHEQVLAAARASGCDEVFTRGQFLGQVETIISRYSASERARIND